MSAIIRVSTPPPVRCSMMPPGRPARDLTEEPEVKKQPFLRKQMIDDMTDFHGFITPGSKFSSQRLDDECSTALPSQCTSAGPLESLPATPAGFGTLLSPPEPGPVQGWQPGLQHPFSDETHIGAGWDIPDHLASFLYCEPHLASPMISPPSTPRQERTADRTCPLAPGTMSCSMLMAALQKNELDLVSQALEADPESALLPFWDHGVEPPLCTAIRLRCKPDIVDHLLKFGADVKARDFAGQSPLDVLEQQTWYSAASSKKMKELLLGAGAEPRAEPPATSPHVSQKKEAMNDMFWWDPVADAGSLESNLYDGFGLPPIPPSLDFDAPFEAPPPSF